MEENEGLDMSLFANADMELNLDLDPIELTGEEGEPTPTPEGEEVETPENIDTTGDEPDVNLSLNEEGKPPEIVVEEEGAEEEGRDQDDDSPNLYSSFATVLSEQGLLPSLDLQGKSIETLDDLSDVFKTEISNQAKQYLVGKVGAEGYEALEMGVSLAELQQYNDTAGTLDNITEDNLHENVELAKKIILQDYVNQGMDQNRAMRILNKSVDLGEDVVVEDALESLASLKEFEANRLASVAESRAVEQAEMAKQQQKIDNDLKNAIYNSEELVPGLGKVNKQMQDKVYQSITKIVGEHNGIAENNLMQKRRENPIDFDTKMYYLFELTNEFSDFTKIVNKSTSTASQKLEKALRTNKFTGSDAPAFLDDKESYGGIGSELVFD